MTSQTWAQSGMKRIALDATILAPAVAGRSLKSAVCDVDMTSDSPAASASPDVHQTVDSVYRAESRRVFATLVRLLGDFDLAEEALHDAFASAVEQWPREGTPANPRAWLVSAGRFK